MTWHFEHIPKFFLCYWGNSTLPWLRYLTLYSFRKYNPDWKIFIFYNAEKGISSDTEDNYWVKAQALDNIVLYPVAGNLEKVFGLDVSLTPDDHMREVYRSDLIRWFLLRTHGGLWSDMDIIYLRSLESMDWNNQTNAQIKSLGLPVPYNNFIMSAIESPLSIMLHSESRRIDPEELAKDPFTTGPLLYEKVRGKKGSEYHFDSFLELPQETTEVVDSDGYDFLEEKPLIILPETVGVHWHGSGYANKFGITETNLLANTSLLAKVIRYMLGYVEETIQFPDRKEITYVKPEETEQS